MWIFLLVKPIVNNYCYCSKESFCSIIIQIFLLSNRKWFGWSEILSVVPAVRGVPVSVPWLMRSPLRRHRDRWLDMSGRGEWLTLSYFTVVMTLIQIYFIKNIFLTLSLFANFRLKLAINLSRTNSVHL